jgi:HK97 family phage portal protein
METEMALRLFRRAERPREAKASAAAPIAMAFGAGGHGGGYGSGRAVWSPRDQVSLARNGYERNVIGFRAVRMVAEAAAAVPLTLSERGERMGEHPLLRVLARPNPGQDGRSLLETVYGQLQLAGNAYVEGVARDAAGWPRELHALRPDRMRVVPGPDGWPMAYEYAVGAARHRWSMEGEAKPILHLKAFHPLDDHYGMSPLEAAATAVDIHNAAANWAKALLDNAARPSGAIVFSGRDGATLPEDAYQRLLREIEENHAGARNAGRPMLLDGGLDWKPMALSPADMEFLETRNAAAREIALAFGVPPQLLGLPGDNTYSNYQEANRAFFRQTVVPLVKKTAAALAAWLAPDGGLALEPDLDAVPALGAERDALWKRVSEADFLDEAEKRALLGLGPRK